MTPALKRVVDNLAALFYPDKCPGCGRHSGPEGFCAECVRAMRRMSQPVCLKCGGRMPAGVSENRETCSWCDGESLRFDTCRSVVLYQDAPARRSVIRLKFHRRRAAAAALSKMMIRYMDENREIFQHVPDISFIVPVPLHWRRLFVRGFNQSELIADGIAANIGKPVTEALKRIKYNKPQSKLKLKERRENVRNAFAHSENIPVKGASVLLIDDVMTSGSTVIECARTLKKAGAAKVHVFTFARRTLE